MLVIGLTGGIACGKSTVAEMLRALGARVVDADEVARQVMTPGSPVLARVVERFGREILKPDGTLDRRRLGGLVFGDRQAREDLNRLTHPAILDAIRRRLEEARREGVETLVIDAPLLLEAGMEDWVDEVWVVACSREQQIDRLRRRDGFALAEAEARLAAQMPLEQKLRRAHRVIRNEGSLEETRRQVLACWREATRRRSEQGER